MSSLTGVLRYHFVRSALIVPVRTPRLRYSSFLELHSLNELIMQGSL
jgi:hypothetical protein